MFLVNLKKDKESIFVIVCFIIFLFFIGFFVYNRFIILEKKEIQASVQVSDRIGFDLNKSSLTFGLVRPGNSVSRNIFIENNFNKRVKVVVKVKGNIVDYLIVSDNNFFINANEKKELGFSVFFPEDTAFGDYSGVVRIILKRA